MMKLKTIVIAVLCISCAAAGGHERKKWMGTKEKSDKECNEVQPEKSELSRIGSVPGKPGVDFPNFSEIPNTKFTCPDKDHVPGFYPDLDTGCQQNSVQHEGKGDDTEQLDYFGQTRDGSDFPLTARSIHGIPGTDFPIFTDIPTTKFSCADQDYVPGFYADVETGCQVFHVCLEDRRESYLCPVGSIFSQHLNACDYWYNVDCSSSPKQGKKSHSYREIEQHELSDHMNKELIDSMLEEICGRLIRTESESRLNGQIRIPKYRKKMAKSSNRRQKRRQCKGMGCMEPEPEYLVQASGTSNFPLVTHPVEGIPGVDFPIFKDIPKTKFTCAAHGYVPGFYADWETGCQVFHVCSEYSRESFLCPIGSIFSPVIKACDYWYNVKCSVPLTRSESDFSEESKERRISDSRKHGLQVCNTPRHKQQMTRYAIIPESDVCYERERQCSLYPTRNSQSKSLKVRDHRYSVSFPSLNREKENICFPDETEKHKSFDLVTKEVLTLLGEDLADQVIQRYVDCQQENDTPKY